jgi:hypothetical protein
LNPSQELHFGRPFRWQTGRDRGRREKSLPFQSPQSRELSNVKLNDQRQTFETWKQGRRIELKRFSVAPLKPQSQGASVSIDQSTDQLQSVLESMRQPGFVNNPSGLHPTMPLPRTPVPKDQPTKSSRKTRTRGGLASEPGVTRPPTPASEVEFLDNETFEQMVAGIWFV